MRGVDENGKHPSKVTKRALITTAILLSGVLLSWWAVHRTDRALREDLLIQTQVIAGVVNTDRVRALTGTQADLEALDYLRLKEQFARAQKANDKCRFIYLMGRLSDGQIFFFVDNEPVGSENESPAGMLYDDVPEGFRQVFDTMQADTEGPFTDRWGTFVSGAVPLIDPVTDDLVAVLAMDMDAGSWKWNIAAIATLPIGLILVLMIVLVSGIKRKQAEEALRLERDKLQRALAEVKQLSDFLPICASCKKIRDDKGYWNQIESYISQHSEAKFSHGICPECAKKLYPEFCGNPSENAEPGA